MTGHRCSFLCQVAVLMCPRAHVCELLKIFVSRVYGARSLAHRVLSKITHSIFLRHSRFFGGALVREGDICSIYSRYICFIFLIYHWYFYQVSIRVARNLVKLVIYSLLYTSLWHYANKLAGAMLDINWTLIIGRLLFFTLLFCYL